MVRTFAENVICVEFFVFAKFVYSIKELIYDCHKEISLVITVNT